ncbi:hypothetical protein [Clostridium sp.]|uniref:hypothetical protein n=1 Tax=Clostridium sp. TaxID=1506 RepID=UPI003D6CB1CE
MNKDYKKILWETDKAAGTIKVSNKSIKYEIEQSFSFKLTRYKNKKYEESLRIECFYNDGKNGVVDTFIYRLDKDLKDFMKYGVAFSELVYKDFQKEIEKAYMYLEATDPVEDENAPKMVDDKIMEGTEGILSMIGSVITEFHTKDEYYHIPVEEFNMLINESDFKIYDLVKIKEWLSKKKFLKCVKGRTTNIVRLKPTEKPIRVISINVSEIEKYIPNKSEDIEKERVQVVK